MEWKEIINEYMATSEGIELNKKVKEARASTKVYPKASETFRAFQLTPYNDVMMVIIGQDPYHNGMADGLAFSSRDKKTPASLQNIFKEIKRYIPAAVHNPEYFQSNSLANWAKNGVLLINAIFTVEEGKPGSHKSFGWIEFTKFIIGKLNENPNPIVYLLWGNFAQGFAPLITNIKHKAILAPHPSPLNTSNPFTGGNSGILEATEFLARNGRLGVKYDFSHCIAKNFFETADKYDELKGLTKKELYHLFKLRMMDPYPELNFRTYEED